MDLKTRAERLLEVWCEAMRDHQIVEIRDEEIEGAMACPACHILHGRCFESMIAFLWMYRRTGNQDWMDRAEKLFYWADRTLTLPDGSFQNDRGSSWVGTTVFNTIAMCDSLIFFKDDLPEEFQDDVKARLRRCAEFLYAFDRVKKNNVNYPITNSVALYLCYEVLGDEKYETKAADFASVIDEVITENGFIFGEGVPREVISTRGCRSMDVGYDVEESLPSIIRYARLAGNRELLKKAEGLMDSHMMFFLDDGGWDNSFGTRNFKWTYWGSRTSDGALPALLYMARKNAFYAECADSALSLLERCTVDGLLAGGPDYGIEGERCCIHHTFEHARMLAGVLLEGLLDIPEVKENHPVGRAAVKGIVHLPEIDSYIYGGRKYTSTVTFYDWGYANLSGGHVSGGMPSLLYWKNHGPLLVSGMGEYSRREPYNMQMPIHPEKHECLDFRIETEHDGAVYSSIYDEKAEAVQEGNSLVARGFLTSTKGETIENGAYEIRYEFSDEKLVMKVSFEQGRLIVPVMCRTDENVETEKGKIRFFKGDGVLEVASDRDVILPENNERIYNLIPGFQALKLEYDGSVKLTFRF